MGPAHSIDTTYPSHKEWPFMWELLCTQHDISDVKASLHKGFHRITERFGLEGTLKFIYFQTPWPWGTCRVKCPVWDAKCSTRRCLFPYSHRAGHGAGGDDKCKRRGSSGEIYALPGQEAGSSHIVQLNVLFKGHCLSFICEMQSSDENLGHSNLCTSNTKSQLLSILLSDTSLTKMETKDDCKAWEAVGALLFRTAISYPARKREPEGRAAEITHSSIYCPKTTSSTKGTTVIIGVKIHSLVTCECDLQRGFIPSERAFGSQEGWAHWLWAAVRVCRLEGHLTGRGMLSPDTAQPQHFRMNPIKSQIQLW